MTENPFARPQATAGDKWDLKNEGHRWLGSLFLIIPKELTPNWKSPNNNYEPTDKVTADVIAVTGPDAGKAWLDTFILSKGIVYILRDKIGLVVSLGIQNFDIAIGQDLITAYLGPEKIARSAV